MLIKKKYYCTGFTYDEPNMMLMGTSDEHSNSNVIEWFLTGIDETFHTLSHVDVISYWVLFNRFEFGVREVFNVGGINIG